MKKIFFLLVFFIGGFIYGQNITKVEYFFDTDPGYDNGTSISFTPDSELNLDITIPISSLSLGVHTLYVRAKDENDKWSLYDKRSFYIANGSSTIPNITQIEYFFDADPGFGKGKPLIFDEASEIDKGFVIPFFGLTVGEHTLYIRAKDSYGKWSLYSQGNVTVTDWNCNYTDVDSTHWWYNAVQDLCGRGIIDNNGLARPDEFINRAELAKVAYKSIDLQNNSLADNFPTPYVDLQDENIWYFKFAKNLSYLEFNDGVAPFQKDFANFRPSGNITRAHVLKVLLETWNIDEIDNSGNNPFTDVKTTDDTYNYIIKAKDLGIIDSGSSFRPNDKALRAEVFVMLYRMLTVNPQAKPTITASSFLKVGNYTPQNLNNFSSIHSGNFNHHTETSFGIASVGIPLVFSHNYNSYLSDMPKELSYLQPLGKMWTHSFNSYIQEFEADPKFPEYFRVGLTLPNGGFQFYKKQGQNYVPETEGVYDELEKTGANYFTLTTKGQIKYKFQKVNADSRFYVLQSIKDRNNNELKIIYEVGVVEIGEENEKEKLVRIKEVIGTAGRKLIFSYYAQSDRLKEVTDPLGRKVSFLFNGNGYLFAYRNPKDLVTIYNYGTDAKEKDLLKTITLPKGNVITSDYENKKLKSIETSGVDPKKYTYVYDDAKGYIDEIISPTGKKTEIDFNKHGNLTNLKDGTTEVEIKYENTDHINYPTEVTYNTQKTSVTYDDKGNILQRMLPEGITQTYQYNIRNDIEQFTDPKGNVYKYAYDSRGNLIRVETPRAKTTFTVNDKGLITQVTNPENISVGFTYDTYGNVIQTNAPEEITTSATFDIASRLLTSTNPKGNTVSYNYDANDNLLSELFGGQTTAYEFDVNDNLTKIINAKNKATTLKYNQDDDTLEKVEFGGAVDEYSYDNDGYIKTYTNPKKVVFTYEYFGDKKLKSVTSGSNSVSYTYDTLDRVETITKNNQETLSFTYDYFDRITEVEDYYNNTVKYSYDRNSNVTSITYPDDKKVTYTYYADNLLKTVTDWNNNTTEYTYRDDGLLTQTLYPNGTKCTFLYDGAGRMVAKTWKKSDDTIINSYSFHLDKMGNHTQEIKTEPFGVIPLNIETQNYSYTDANRLQSVNSTTFDFDDNGNNTVKGDIEYSYDVYDRLIEISKAGYTAEYKYDAFGNRREKTVNGTTQRFVLDILGLSNVLAETDEHGAYQNYYVYGLGLISRTDYNDNTHYYHDDFRGSTIAMTDDRETITHKYAYDDFGKVTQIEEANLNPYRYVGKYGIQYEDEDLYFMRARYYNPDVGRFLTEDPVWATNLYPYAGNNPVMNVDPSGETYIGIGTSPSSLSYESQSFILIDAYNEAYDYTTEKGAEACYYYSEGYLNSSSIGGKIANGAGGAFACLWTPESAWKTELALSLGPKLIGSGINAVRKGGPTFAKFKNSYWSTRTKPVYQSIKMSNGKSFKIYEELHHRFIPQRAKWVPDWLKNNRLNLQPLNTIQHGVRDPYRFRFFPTEIKNAIRNGNTFGY